LAIYTKYGVFSNHEPARQNRPASLDKNLKAHLEDFILMREIDLESIESRIRDVNPKLCTVGLRPVLPPALFEELAKKEFQPISHSLRVVFSPWLREQRQ